MLEFHLSTIVFNIINLLLAAAVLAVGAYKNALFIGVVLCNAAIGIFQEIRAKRVVDKLSFLSQAQVTVIRDGEGLSLPIDEVVLDDVLAFSNGSQICADSVVLTGECEVNESFVTGESDAVFKKPGDLLLAGSFVVSGACRARAVRPTTPLSRPHRPIICVCVCELTERARPSLAS